MKNDLYVVVGKSKVFEEADCFLCYDFQGEYEGYTLFKELDQAEQTKDTLVKGHGDEYQYRIAKVSFLD